MRSSLLSAARRGSALCALLLTASVAHADEGLWPFDMVPTDAIAKAHNVTLTKEWLDHLRLSTVRISVGGTGSFVSSTGLILTNHHVASDCISKIASSSHNYMDNGFYAARDGGEAKCPDMAVDVLVATEDVTDAVRAAKQPSMSDADANVAMKAKMGELEKACTEKNRAAMGADGISARCEVVTLYAGGKYHLYTYRRYTDLRLVFAPEAAIAFFGGDPDNFTYPRFDLDMALFRAYSGNKPITPEQYLKWSAQGPKDGEVAFVSGNPGSTRRLATVAQLEQIRDVSYARALESLKKERDLLKELSAQGHEYDREARESLFDVENSIKALAGYLGGLRDPALMKIKKDDEAALQKAIDGKPDLKAQYGTTIADVAKVQAQMPKLYPSYGALERLGDSTLLGVARHLVRMSDEVRLPSTQRLREYRDANLEEIKLELFSGAPVYGEVEIVAIRSWLERAQRDLHDQPEVLAKIFGGQTAGAVAREIATGSRLYDVYARRKLEGGGKAAIAASEDPAIALIRNIDGAARAARKKYEDAIEAPMRQLGQQVAQATFAVRGTSTYPDATFTLRLSVGVVKGYTEAGKAIPFATDFGGMYGHATGKDPFKLPQRWLDKRASLTQTTKLNFVSTDDIIGGNSGSPVVNGKGELVGLIFDGNLSSLPNNFVYREVTERSVSVVSDAMTEALRKIYDAEPLATELTR
jgi:S1-C subfamily serine protease